MAAALVGLGSNVGDRLQTLDRAVERLAAHSAIVVQAKSAWRATAPVGGPAGQEEFLNGAVLLDTSLSAIELFAHLQSIEQVAGRERLVPWGPRTLDLDLLLFGDAVLQTPDLTVPHPRMAFRRFVVDPVAQIAPDWIHPVIGWSLGRIREHLHTATPYIALAGPRSPAKSQLARNAAAAVGGVYLSDPADLSLDVPGGSQSAGPPTPHEIQFLELRARQIPRANWPYGTTPAISDFWILDSIDNAATSAAPASVNQSLATTMPCKLLVACGELSVIEAPPVPMLQIPDVSSMSALSELIAAIQAMEARS
jgi:2-amino-4-hydroxy-6-hydroxymethyldihydropteridine diphosphokinase